MPMATKAYNYDPTKITEYGIDRMRFELGDTMVEGEENTSALTDAEYQAAIDCYPTSWKKAKLMCVESIYHRYLYECDTETGPLKYDLTERAKMWEARYKQLKAEVDKIGVPSGDVGSKHKPPYFHTDMMQNIRSEV